MEKVEFQFTLSEAQKQAKLARVEKLLRHPQLLAWRKQHTVSDAFIYDHSGSFQDYCDVMERCAHCQGLTFCTQPLPGRRMELLLDDMLLKQLCACPYYQRQQQLYAHEHGYRQMDMPREYLLVDLSKLDLRKESSEYKLVVMQVLQQLMDEAAEKGIYFWGKPGVGKSYLAAGITNFYAKKGKRVAFVNTAKLIADLKMMFHDSAAMEAKLQMIRSVDVLVLDDIGGESVTAWSRDDILLPILDARMEKQKKTFFTSNYRQAELKEKLAMSDTRKGEPMAAERLLERIGALTCEVFVKGCSRRK